MLRVLFMGTPEFACPSLAAIHAAGHQVVAAVCQPDRPAGRGQRLTAPPVKRLAQSLGIPVLQPPRVRRPEVVAELSALRPDIIVTAAFGQILSADLLAVPRLGALNVHASLLPKYRGAAPIHRAIMAGETVTGVTIMWMDEGLDTGDMLLWQAEPIYPDDTAGTLHDRLSKLGAGLIVKALRAVERDGGVRVPQAHQYATYAPKLTKRDEWIDWQRTAGEIVNQVRGLNPWPVAYTGYGEGILKVWRAEPAALPPDAGGAAPGTVVAVLPGRGPVVACGHGAVVLTEVQPQGKRRMDGAAFLAGYRLRPGDRLGCPPPPG